MRYAPPPTSAKPRQPPRPPPPRPHSHNAHPAPKLASFARLLTGPPVAHLIARRPTSHHAQTRRKAAQPPAPAPAGPAIVQPRHAPTARRANSVRSPRPPPRPPRRHQPRPYVRRGLAAARIAARPRIIAAPHLTAARAAPQVVARPYVRWPFARGAGPHRRFARPEPARAIRRYAPVPVYKGVRPYIATHAAPRVRAYRATESTWNWRPSVNRVISDSTRVRKADASPLSTWSSVARRTRAGLTLLVGPALARKAG